MASVVPCYHAGALFGCALATAGALQGTGSGVDVPEKDTTFYAAVGGRVGAEVRVTEWLALAAFGDLRGTLTRTTLQIDGHDVWTTPPVSGALGVAAVFGQAP
jgi:hypothetical protein